MRRCSGAAFPVLLHGIVGAEDHRFAALATDVARMRPATCIQRPLGCGHNPLLDAPQQLQLLLAQAGHQAR